MDYIKLDYSKTLPYIDENYLPFLQNIIKDIHKYLLQESLKENESLGWINLPIHFKNAEIEKIKKEANIVRENAEILLVIGIGGSYMGARAGIELLNHSFHNNLSKEKNDSPQVFFVGTNLSSTYISDLIDLLHGKDFSINVVSKSGSSLETTIAFRVFNNLLIKKYGEKKAKTRVYITTDPKKGILKEFALKKGYTTFSIPENVGGRFSVLTAVGLFPIAVSGICIEKVLEGAKRASFELNQRDTMKNPAYQYAAIRNILYNKGKTIEILASYEPKLQSFKEWWKQLFAESEGKNHQGIFPTTALFSTDLHSIGQYIQDGKRNLFETIIRIERSEKELILEEELEDWDGLNYLSGKSISFVNEKALEGTVISHLDGGVPNLVINIPEVSPFTFGYLAYFFQLSCVLSSHVLGVNPFDQPGVEYYKRNMYNLLGQPEKSKERRLEQKIITY